jgi:hypothetical protein
MAAGVKPRTGGLALILAAVLVMVLSYLVDTDSRRRSKSRRGWSRGIEQRD